MAVIMGAEVNWRKQTLALIIPLASMRLLWPLLKSIASDLQCAPEAIENDLPPRQQSQPGGGLCAACGTCMPVVVASLLWVRLPVPESTEDLCHFGNSAEFIFQARVLSLESRRVKVGPIPGHGYSAGGALVQGPATVCNRTG
jgi:hypothetical protein